VTSIPDLRKSFFSQRLDCRLIELSVRIFSGSMIDRDSANFVDFIVSLISFISHLV